MKWSTWNKVALGGIAAAALSVIAFNVVLDPWSTLKTAEWMRQGYNLNERFRKVEFLRHNIGKFDSFILGSSTMGLWPVEPAAQSRPEGRWYNLAFLAGTPPDALRALKYLHSQGQPIKEVVYGIDIFAFRKAERSREMWKREHPLVAETGWWDWYRSHLFASSFLFGLDRIAHEMKQEPRMFFDVDGTGRYYLLDWDRQIAQDETSFIKKQIYAPLEKRGELQSNNLVLIQERFDELADLKRWLDEQGVVSHFFINPMHWATIASIQPASLAEFRSKVREAVGEVPDYSLREDFIRDDRKFYEVKHYRPSTAALMASEILGAGQVPAPGRLAHAAQGQATTAK